MKTFVTSCNNFWSIHGTVKSLQTQWPSTCLHVWTCGTLGKQSQFCYNVCTVCVQREWKGNRVFHSVNAVIFTVQHIRKSSSNWVNIAHPVGSRPWGVLQCKSSLGLVCKADNHWVMLEIFFADLIFPNSSISFSFCPHIPRRFTDISSFYSICKFFPPIGSLTVFQYWDIIVLDNRWIMNWKRRKQPWPNQDTIIKVVYWHLLGGTLRLINPAIQSRYEHYELSSFQMKELKLFLPSFFVRYT